ncbi:MAG: flagellin [Lachnospiraceae bacterium]|nr:flagellin [Lachnospiraceae bacterium]MDD7328031.1 flagellin [Lachnospiraceae bacterium]MDY2760186.1 flagellin [Lachnospiraceae bacterium]
MVVQHNMQAANSNRMLGITTSAQAKSTEKLSSGYKINRAADDAAGLAISEKMRSQVRGLDRASTNAQDGISVVQTAEGALNEVHSILQRMNELATQAANDTNTSIDRSQIKLEMDQLSSEIDRVASTTQFNTQNLLDGSFSGKNLQVGSLSGQKIELSINAMNTKFLGLDSTTDAVSKTASDVFEGHKSSKMASDTAPAKLSVSSFSDAGQTMKLVQRAIDVVSTQRATLGAVQNRLEHTIANLDNISENTQAAESRIRDTDMAKEMVTYSKNNILQQAGQSMLAQANQSNQGVLSLLQ